MTLVVIGSTAAKMHIPDWRDPKDFDAFASHNEKIVGESNSYDVFYHPKIVEHFGEHCIRTATLDELYTIKVSHSFWELPNSSWEKHTLDQMKLKEHGAKLDSTLFGVLYSVWEEIHGSKRLKLKLEASDFFKDAVKREFDHDSIHETVAIGDRPLYESVLKDGSSVDIDSKKLWRMSDEDRVSLFREEIYATALERIILPSKYKASARGAYYWALRRTMTSLTTGRSARYISENFDKFVSPYRENDNFMQRHFEKSHKLVKLEEGRTIA